MGTTGDAPVGPVAGVGSTAGHVLRDIPEPVATDSARQSAKDFEKSLVGLPPGERVAQVKQKTASVAEENGWTRNNNLGKKNGRTVYTDKNGDHYSVDVQHGHIEKFNTRGKHQGSVDMDLIPNKPADPSGQHGIEL